jgi:ABC-type branched-subunit amino acid transport system substrate-binding protein
MMKNRIAKEKGLGIAILAIALAVLLVITACAPRPIAKEQTVQFGWIMPLTGAVSSPVQVMLSGGEDYLRYFNEQEAIPAVRIERLWRDSRYETPLSLSHYERLAEAGVPLIIIEQLAPLRALRESFVRDEVVAFMSGGGYHEITYPGHDWIYTISPSIGEQAAVVFQYFMENWEEERPPRVALLGMEGGWGYEPRYVTEYATSLGFEVLPPEVVPVIVLDATVQLLRLKEAGADLVHIQALASSVGSVLNDAERLGLLDQIQFAGHSSAMGERVIEQTGVASEGFLTSRPYPWFNETEVPGIKLIIDNMMKYHGEVKTDAEYFSGWVGVAVICEAIRRAIETVGYENLDGPAIKEALDGMKDFDVYGLASITYKPGDHRGATKMAVYEVRGGEIVRASDWREAPSGCDWEYE